MLFTFAASLVALSILSASAALPSTQTISLANSIGKHSRLVKDDGAVDFDALDKHVGSVKSKIHRGFHIFERNTGTTHPSSVKSVQKNGYGNALKDDRNIRWYGNISVGSPPVSFSVDVDTGSSDLFLPMSTCDQTCSGHTLWDPTSSSTARALGQNFTINFGGSSTVSGEKYTDTVSVGNLTATHQTLGAVTTYSPSFQRDSFPADGLMGMGFQSISVYGASPFFQTLVTQNKVTDPVFSLKLSFSGAEMFIGGSNPALYSGNFSYTPVTHQGFWQVNMDDIRGNGNKILINIDVIIDTGSSLIIVPPSNISALYSALGGEPAPPYYVGEGYHTFPCESFPTVSLTFGGTSFPIPASALNLGPLWYDSTTCISSIVSHDMGTSFWVIGDIFLRNVYTAFDVGKSRVGFAHLAQ